MMCLRLNLWNLKGSLQTWLSSGSQEGLILDLGWTLNIVTGVTGVLIRAKRRLEGGHRGQGCVYRKAEVDVIKCRRPQECQNCCQSSGARRQAWNSLSLKHWNEPVLLTLDFRLWPSDLWRNSFCFDLPVCGDLWSDMEQRVRQHMLWGQVKFYEPSRNYFI